MPYKKIPCKNNELVPDNLEISEIVYLTDVSNEIFEKFVQYLEIKDICSLSQTCSFFYHHNKETTDSAKIEAFFKQLNKIQAALDRLKTHVIEGAHKLTLRKGLRKLEYLLYHRVDPLNNDGTNPQWIRVRFDYHSNSRTTVTEFAMALRETMLETLYKFKLYQAQGLPFRQAHKDQFTALLTVFEKELSTIRQDELHKIRKRVEKAVRKFSDNSDAEHNKRNCTIS